MVEIDFFLESVAVRSGTIGFRNLSKRLKPKRTGEKAAAAILDLKDQIGSLRKDLHHVRETLGDVVGDVGDVMMIFDVCIFSKMFVKVSILLKMPLFVRLRLCLHFCLSSLPYMHKLPADFMDLEVN